MTDARYDRAPGDISISAEAKERTLSDVGIYTIGLTLAVILTATSFWVANTSLLWAPGIPLGLVVLAIAQMGVHLVFFLHITTGPDNTNNVLALAFGVLIVIIVAAGSLWIMTNLDDSMTPPAELMNLHMNTECTCWHQEYRSAARVRRSPGIWLPLSGTEGSPGDTR